MPQGSASRPPRQGTPCWVPVHRLFAVVFDVLSHLDDQTTFKLDETKSATSVLERASQRFENRVDMTTARQERPQNAREAHKNVRRITLLLSTTLTGIPTLIENAPQQV